MPEIPATAEWQLPPEEWARVDRACGDRFDKSRYSQGVGGGFFAARRI